MPITLTINGESAEHILAELETFSRALTKPKIEWRQVSSAELDVRMAADIPAAPDFGYTPAPEMADVTFKDGTAKRVEVVIEDKPKRKRRTKEEMEAERAAGLPPQEGDPDLEPVVEVVDDILDDDTSPSAPATATRDDVVVYMSKIIQQRLLTPKEIREVFQTRAGGATNAAAMDDRFAADVLAGLTEAAEKKSA